MLASLRLRILAVVAVALVAATLIGGLQARSSAQKLAQSLQDQNLRAMAFGFFSSVTASQGSWVTPEELSDFIPADVDQYFYRLLGPKGAYISGYNFVRVPAQEDAEPGVPYFATWTDGSGDTYRGVSIRAFVDNFDVPGWVTLQVAQSTRRSEQLVGEQMRSYYLTAAVISIAALAAAVVILSTIFRPLSRLAQSVERRNAEDLSPIQQNVPVEVRPLKNRLNALFETVSDEQQAKNRLISNVAHQLRTPLTTIRVRSDLALNADNPKPHLEALDREARRAADMASQLVVLESQSEAQTLETLVLADIIGSLVEDWRLPFKTAGVVLDVQIDTSKAQVKGAVGLIEEMLSNLLDNALKHAEASRVEVRVVGRRLVVQDNGKGVLEDDLPRLFERFFSLGEEANRGHGLGLAIVEEFATRMGARVGLKSADGLAVTIDFEPA